MESISRNNLYPVFFRLDNVKLLIVGGGEVGEEKLRFILKSSPNANLAIVATWLSEEVKDIIEMREQHTEVTIREIREEDILNNDIIIAATNIHDVNRQVYQWAKQNNKIINVADTPDLCDFYMGSIVTKGDLKIAISTNGKSPTFAKRFRQYLEDLLPDDTPSLINNLKHFRDGLRDDFSSKVSKLNQITKSLISK